jgi:Phytanoyl-CoA dioxygenase (PhyH)
MLIESFRISLKKHDWQAKLARNGFVVLPGIFAATQIDDILFALERAFQGRPDDLAIRSDAGAVYAARNVLMIWPDAATVWRQPPLPNILADLLGPDYGLVRVLYFDKPPDRTWALPWHKDLTIAVREHRGPTLSFTKPTLKAGLPHVEAPEEVLQKMLAVRIHLDAVTQENGPLQVIPGSHRTGKVLRLGDTPPQTILVDRGDVLGIRPLVAHSSIRSRPNTPAHRRILHLEFAASPDLPDGYHWHDFRPG